MKIPAPRLYTTVGLAAILLVVAVPAQAQYKPRPLNDPATGESYHIEVAGDMWSPSISSNVSVEGLGIPGDTIDLKRDLGVVDKRMTALDLVLRPTSAHKFRFQYLPIKYEASSTLNHDIVFNGIRYRLGVPVNSTLDWKTYSLGYEFDFVQKDWGFVGFILEAKITDVQVSLNSPILTTPEFAQMRAPIPALGGIGRVYVVPNISITGEFSMFKLPDTIDGRYNAHYYDLNIYGTVNFTNHVGVKGGYRSRDVGFLVETDSGSFDLKGIFFGAVLRY
jgi:hypothetical protein